VKFAEENNHYAFCNNYALFTRYEAFSRYKACHFENTPLPSEHFLPSGGRASHRKQVITMYKNIGNSGEIND